MMPYPDKVSNISASLQVLQVIFHSCDILLGSNNFLINFVGCPCLQSACFPLTKLVVQLACLAVSDVPSEQMGK